VLGSRDVDKGATQAKASGHAHTLP
jgi:hypothetical protein